jgi:hypothetical protein
MKFLVWWPDGRWEEMDGWRVHELSIYWDTVQNGPEDLRRWTGAAMHGDVLRVGQLRVLAVSREALR